MSDVDQGRLKLLNREAASILDGLIADGVICGYRTGTASTYGAASDTTVLIVVASRGSDDEDVKSTVRDALPGNWHINVVQQGDTAATERI